MNLKKIRPCDLNKVNEGKHTHTYIYIYIDAVGNIDMLVTFMAFL